MNRRLGRNIVFFKISLKCEYTQLALRVFSLQFNFSKYNVPPASTDSLHNINFDNFTDLILRGKFVVIDAPFYMYKQARQR